jgi:anti-sigma regulatory factor (Ser/Thr protein kinase)
MANSVFASYRIEDRSYLAYIKREIHNQLTVAGFGVTTVGEIDIIVSELTSNIIKHADEGEVLYCLGEENGRKYFEIFTLDAGPGIQDVNRMMGDGVSSSNTLGHGLGAIKRLSDIFQIYSKKNWGTVAYSKTWLTGAGAAPAQNKENLSCSVLQVCIPGERLCGDGFHVKKQGDETHIFLGDGLGHGIHAYDAVQAAIEAFKKCTETEPGETLRYIHANVKKTRGLVGTVAILNPKKQEWRICGIGNITTRLFEGMSSKNYMAHNGILGHNIPNTINDYVTKEEKYQCIIMYSDGIKGRWNLASYPSLLRHDPAVIAGTIFKDNARRTDDMSILVGKVNF